METKAIKVTDKHEVQHDALLTICPNCKRDAFNVLIIKGHNHLQCTYCFTSYCQNGTCK